VQLCVLALLLERAAESRCQQTWRTIRQTLDQLKVIRYRLQGKTLVQSTRVTSPLAEIRQSLGMPLPKKILAVFE
jgi:type IV secretory pathway VirJ component